MYGTWFINFCVSIVAFLFYFLLTFTSHSPTIVITQSVLVAFIFFIFTFIVRWMIGYSIKSPSELASKEEAVNTRGETQEIEQNVDMEKLIKQLPDDDVKQVASYIKDLLNNKD